MDRSQISDYIYEGVKARTSLDENQIEQMGSAMIEAFRTGKKLILMGNGGSAADAQHIAAEFVGRFEKERKPLPALALHTNTSSLTAISNDYSYNEIFSRQIKAFASPGDVVIGLSTSGNSSNVVEGMKAAKEIGCYCVALTGAAKGKIDECSDSVLKVKSTRTSIIQEVHISIGHIWSKIVEDELFGE